MIRRTLGNTGHAVNLMYQHIAALADIKRWYVERFLRLRETAFADPASYFYKYASLSPDQAVDVATHIWDSINGPNLHAHRTLMPVCSFTRSRSQHFRRLACHSV